MNKSSSLPFRANYLKLTAFFLLFSAFSCNNESTGRVSVNSISVTRERISLVPGGEATIQAMILPYDVSADNLVWTSSDPAVATVEDGKVKAVDYGQATVTASIGDISAQCIVNVKYAMVGAYYFDGWAGRNAYHGDPEQPWATNAPTHLTKKFAEEYSDRQPVWGWRDDSQEIFDRQLDLAVENGVDFFLYCWYWRNNRGAINEEAIKNDSHHTSMYLHMSSQKKKQLQYCLLVANHGGSEILGEHWGSAVRHWAEFFRDPMYVTVDGKPLVVLFSAGEDAITDEEMELMQETAKSIGFPDGIVIAGCGAAAVGRNFEIRSNYNVVPGYDSGLAQRDYSVLVEASKEAWKGTTAQPYIPVVTCGWDKRPWDGASPDGLNAVPGWYYTGDTPDIFKGFLNDSFEWLDRNAAATPKERIVLIYAWNELGEGGYLVPTVGDPQASKLRKIGELLEEKVR